MPLSIRDKRDAERKSISTLRDGFVTAIPASGFNRQEKHCVVGAAVLFGTLDEALSTKYAESSVSLTRRTQPLSKTLSMFKN